MELGLALLSIHHLWLNAFSSALTAVLFQDRTGIPFSLTLRDIIVENWFVSRWSDSDPPIPEVKKNIMELLNKQKKKTAVEVQTAVVCGCKRRKEMDFKFCFVH